MLEIIPQKLPTLGQLERDLSQITYKLYCEELGHSPGKITYKFLSNNLAIVIEDALPTLEKALMEENKDSKIVKDLNLAINNIIRSKLRILIKEVLAVEVCDILFNSSLETHHAGAIVILSQLPTVRPRKPIAKVQKSQYENKHIQCQPKELTIDETDKTVKIG